MSDAFLFDSDGHDEATAFENYAQLYARGSNVARADGPFLAKVAAYRLDGLLLFERRLSGATHFRDAGRVADDGFDHLVMHAVLEGAIDVAGDVGRIEAGEALLQDTSRPMRHTPRTAHFITVSLARYHLAPVIDQLDDLHHRVLRPPATLVLHDFLRSLVRHAATAAATRSLSHAFVELLAGALAKPESRRADRGREEVLRREAVEQFVCTHLGDRKLGADTIGEALGMSRSALYRLMEQQGGVTQFVQKKRLQAVRGALERGSELSLGDLAERYGFSDEARLRRLFLRAFSLTPAAYRAELRAAEGDQTRIAYRRWEGWMGDLS